MKKSDLKQYHTIIHKIRISIIPKIPDVDKDTIQKLQNYADKDTIRGKMDELLKVAKDQVMKEV